MDFLKRHKWTYLAIGLVLIISGAYPLWSLFNKEDSPCRRIVSACKVQKFITTSTTDRKEIFQKCFKPVFETLRLGDAYFKPEQAEECRQFAVRKRIEREAKQAAGQDPDEKQSIEE